MARRGNTPTMTPDFPKEPVWSVEGFDEYGQSTTIRFYIYHRSIYIRCNYDGNVEQEYQPTERESRHLGSILLSSWGRGDK